MDSGENSYTTIDEYIGLFPKDVQAILQTIRTIIKEEIPNAQETISYRVPTFKLHGSYVVYLAAFKNHISIYPLINGTESDKEIGKYRTGKGTIQFPLDKPLPYPLIRKIVQLLLKENRKRTKK